MTRVGIKLFCSAKNLSEFAAKVICAFQVPTGGVPIVHGNPTWSDCSVWFQARWGGDHPVHSGAPTSILCDRGHDSIHDDMNMSAMIT